MRRLTLLAGLTAGATILAAAPATAQSWGYDQGYGTGYGYAAPTHTDNCRKIRNEQRLVGGLIGGVAGAALGGALADDDDDDHYHRRGWRGRGYHHRHYRYHHYDDDDGDQVAGIVIGALVGGLAGSELAGAASGDCEPWRYADVPPPTRQAYGYGWEGPVEVRSTGGYSDNLYGGQATARDDSRVRDCELVWRETRLPDGRLVREQVEACRDGEVYYEPRVRYGDWGLED